MLHSVGTEIVDRGVDDVDRPVDAEIDDGLEECRTSGAVELCRARPDLLGEVDGGILTRTRSIEGAKAPTNISRDVEDPDLLTCFGLAVAILLDLGCDRDLTGGDD